MIEEEHGIKYRNVRATQEFGSFSKRQKQGN